MLSWRQEAPPRCHPRVEQHSVELRSMDLGHQAPTTTAASQ